MRTISFRSNVLFIVAAAAGLLAALGRPWYGTAPTAKAEAAGIGDVQGPVEGFFMRLGREVATSGGTTGWDAFSRTDLILVVLAGIAVFSALCALAPGAEQPAREVLRLVTLAMLAIVIVKLVKMPHEGGLVERRQGLWIALGVTGVMASSASALYSAPLTRRKRGSSLVETPFVAPPRSTAFDSPGTSAAPPERF